MRVQRLNKVKLCEAANKSLAKADTQTTMIGMIPYITAASILLGIADALEEVEPNETEGGE